MNKMLLIAIISISTLIILSGCTNPGPTPNPGPAPNPENCLNAGETQAVLAVMTPCCEGLSYIPTSSTNADGECQASTGSVVCSNCGNGICEEWESSCTCSTDCPIEPSLVKEMEELYNEIETIENTNLEEIQDVIGE